MKNRQSVCEYGEKNSAKSNFFLTTAKYLQDKISKAHLKSVLSFSHFNYNFIMKLIGISADFGLSNMKALESWK